LPSVRLAELWRYPVKSMAGERLAAVGVSPDGIAGDRVVVVRDPRGKIVTSRSRPALLGLHATLGPDNEPVVDGRHWRDPEVAAAVEAAAGPGCRLELATDTGRFDILPLLVATDGALAAFGHDHRRLRPNLVIGGVDGLAERSWERRVLAVGETRIGIHSLRERCIMTTFDPDTQEQDVEVLLKIRRDFGGRIALNAYVVRGGVIREGDPVALV
jgi:uncharacterized protein YcbX